MVSLQNPLAENASSPKPGMKRPNSLCVGGLGTCECGWVCVCVCVCCVCMRACVRVCVCDCECVCGWMRVSVCIEKKAAG